MVVLLKKSGFLTMLAMATCLMVFGTGCSDSEVSGTDVSKSSGPNPVATITMKSGKVIKVELYPDVAPNTVNNFISLANSGFYDGTIFHRVIEGFMIQGGDPLGTGTGGPGYSIKGEFSSNGFKNNLKHTEGVISMARAGHPDSAGSQFFIMHQDGFFLDGQYAAFGEVTDGMDVVDAIASVRTDRNDRPVEEQKIKSITVTGEDIEEPVKLKNR